MIVQIPVESWGREVVLSVHVDHDPGDPGDRESPPSEPSNEIVDVLRDGVSIKKLLEPQELAQLYDALDDAVGAELDRQDEERAYSLEEKT